MHNRGIAKGFLAKLKEMKRDVVALTFAIRDPRCPKSARWVAAVVLAYALSPIDLIPDFIPVLGALDDLILVPLGIVLVERMIPAEVMASARLQASDEKVAKSSTAGLVLVLMTWIAVLAAAYFLIARH